MCFNNCGNSNWIIWIILIFLLICGCGGTGSCNCGTDTCSNDCNTCC